MSLFRKEEKAVEDPAEERRLLLVNRQNLQKETREKFETLAPHSRGKKDLKFSDGVKEIVKRLELEFFLDFVYKQQADIVFDIRKDQKWRLRRLPKRFANDKERALIERFDIGDDGTEVVYKPVREVFIPNIDPEEVFPEFVVIGGAVMLLAEEKARL